VAVPTPDTILPYCDVIFAVLEPYLVVNSPVFPPMAMI